MDGQQQTEQITTTEGSLEEKLIYNGAAAAFSAMMPTLTM